MYLGHLSGITYNGTPVLWCKNDNGTYQCLFTTYHNNQQTEIPNKEQGDIKKLISQRLNIPADEISKETCFNADSLNDNDTKFIPFIQLPKNDAASSGSQISSFNSQSAKSESSNNLNQSSARSRGQQTPNSSAVPGLFRKGPTEKTISLENIVTEPSDIRVTTCFDDSFIKNNQKLYDKTRSFPILREAHVSSLLSMETSDWILRIRQHQSQILDNIVSNTIAKACEGKLTISGPVKAFLNRAIVRIMNDNLYSNEPTQYERYPHNPFQTKKAFEHALQKACLTYASNNTLFLQFLIDDTMEPNVLSDNEIVQKAMTFMRMYVQENPITILNLKAQLEELVKLSMMAGLLERIRKLIQLQAPGGVKKPNSEEQLLLDSYLLTEVIKPSKHRYDQAQLTIDLSVIRELIEFINALQPGFENHSARSLQSASENQSYTFYSCQKTLFSLTRNYFKDDESAQNQVDILYKAIIEQINDANKGNNAHWVAGTLTTNADSDFFLVLDAYKALITSFEEKLPVHSSRDNKRQNLLIKDQEASDIAKFFIQKYDERNLIKREESPSVKTY
ncbi:hypothetical protein [Legionella sp. W05-934-2]|uniref:hypothetical protein n=1 Tax=Legionella sp. W05-934-2 TaxID=1198649 RepID=UPI0034622EFE